MFKIGEFSKITQVSIRMLRYYDEQKLLMPCKVDPSTGYRLYSASQIDDLSRIVMLRDMGFSIKEMQKLVSHWEEAGIKEELEKQIEKTKQTIQNEQQKLLQIQGYLAELNEQPTRAYPQIVIKTIPTVHVLSLRRVMPNYFCEAMLWQELGEYIREIKGMDFKTSFSIYHDLDYREQEVDIEVCVGMNGQFLESHSKLVYRQVEEVERAASFMIYGDYHQISPAYKAFAYWLEAHKEYEMAGENRQICHVSACDTDNPEDYITEMLIPLRYSNRT